MRTPRPPRASARSTLSPRSTRWSVSTTSFGWSRSSASWRPPEGFTGQPGVINGASEFLGEVFGDAGIHARSAVGVAELPLGSAGRGGTDRRSSLMSTVHPAYAQLRRVTDIASVLLENNPGMMTLDGTNTWILHAPGSDECVVVDPGDNDEEHLQRVAGIGPVALTLITHRHFDHTGGVEPFPRIDLGSSAFRRLPTFLRGGATTLVDGEVIEVAGLSCGSSRLRDIPLTRCRSSSRTMGSVLTGDTILGRGTTVLDDSDGDLGDYLTSLRALHRTRRRTNGSSRARSGPARSAGDFAAVPCSPRGASRSGAGGSDDARRVGIGARCCRARLLRRRPETVAGGGEIRQRAVGVSASLNRRGICRRGRAKDGVV